METDDVIAIIVLYKLQFLMDVDHPVLHISEFDLENPIKLQFGQVQAFAFDIEVAKQI